MKQFVVKWNNGYWKVFDTLNFSDTIVCKLQTEAEAQVSKLNA